MRVSAGRSPNTLLCHYQCGVTSRLGDYKADLVRYNALICR